MDIGGTSIATSSSYPVNIIYYSASSPSTTGTVDGGQTSGTLVPGGSATVTSSDPIQSLSGSTYTSGDGFRYHTLSTALVLPAGTYEIANSQFGKGFGSNATGLAAATGVSSPTHATFVNPDDTGAYNANTFDANLPGNFGPNFLISVPEPASLGLLGFVAFGCLARRRQPW